MAQTIQLSRPGIVAAFVRMVGEALNTFGRTMVRLGESSPIMMSLDNLHATSDQALRDKGLTRENEVMRILASRGFF